MNQPTKEDIQELVDCLSWYVENDETNPYAGNEYYLVGQEAAERLLKKFKALGIEPTEGNFSDKQPFEACFEHGTGKLVFVKKS